MNSKPVIGMILERTFPPDIRVEKEARSLIKSGFEVHLLCLSKSQNLENSNHEGMHVHGNVLPLPKTRRYASRLIRAITLNDFYWLSAIKHFVKKHAIDILHVHDLPLVSTAIMVKRTYPNIKVIADFHENYPAGTKEWMSKSRGIEKFFAQTFYRYERWDKKEESVCKDVDHIIAVVDEMKDRLIDKHHIEASKITVVRNFEDTDFVAKATLDNQILERYRDCFNILYIGGFGPHRGIDTAIKAMPYLKHLPIKLTIVGKGMPDVESWLKSLIYESNAENNIEFLGWQPFDKVVSFMKAANIGLVPHHANEHTNNTIPHKLFQYMLAGLPVVVSDCKPLARYVELIDSGAIFKSGDPKDFAKTIETLYKNPGICRQYAKNGLNADHDFNINWESQGEILCDLYQAT